MPVYVIAQGRIENRDMLNEYVGKALPTIQSGGGRVLAFDETPNVVEGQIEPKPAQRALIKKLWLSLK